MSTRKRWRTTVIPTFTVQSHQSQAAVYRYVDHVRELRRLGMVRTERITVEVSEGGGKWELYERIILPRACETADGNGCECGGCVL